MSLLFTELVIVIPVPIFSHSAKAGQRMMSRILGYEVPFEICHNIRLRRFETVDDALQAASIIRSLYGTFMAKESLSMREKHAIRGDAFLWLVRVAWRWMHKARVQQEFLALTFQLNPLIVAKIIASKVVRRAWCVIERSRFGRHLYL